MEQIQGSGGGKGGGGQTFREDENTLKSNVIVSTIEAWGEGPVVGPINGARSVFLNNTPIQNKDGTFNFGGKVALYLRTGLPTQDHVPGFEYTGDPVNVNTEVLNSASVTQTVSDALVSMVALTISLPQGLYEQKTDSNALIGAQVQLAVDVKLSASGTWVEQRQISWNDKTTSAYQETFRISRPAGTGVWDFRVRRITADSASSTLRNNTFLAYFTELQDTVTSYPNIAYMALQVDASSVNSSQIPTRSAEIYGLIVEVPTNYNEITRVYTGTWDGTFKNAWTNDPAWVLYALATNTRWGLGLDEALVDKYSFYDASVYSSELVTFTNKLGTTSTAPRFSFNYQIAEAQLAPELLNKVAAVMNAKVMWMGGQLTVLQDRPTSFSHIFNKSNIIGAVKYVGTPMQTRNTVANVTWNDPSTHYQQRVSSVEDTAGIAKYGYNPVNIAAYGVTNEAEAIRKGKWYLDTVLNQTETVTFDTGLEGQMVIPGEVIRLYDEDYAAQVAAGRLAAGSTTTVIQLDRAVTLIGTSYIDICLPDGTIYADKALVGGSTGSAVTVSTPLATAPSQYCTFIIRTNGISAREFRVSKVTEKSRGLYTIEGGTYDSTKYARVETGVSMEPPVFTNARRTVVAPPTSLFFNERIAYIDNRVQRSVVLSWTPSTSAVVPRYQVTYRVAGGQLQSAYTAITNFEVPNVTPGVLEVNIYAVSFKDVLSLPLKGRYTVETTEGTGSELSPVTNLQVLGGGTSFTGRSLTASFVNPAINGTTSVSVADFKVEVYNSDGSSLLRTEYIPPVPPGATQTYTYDYDKNLLDGGPRRSLTINVYARDGNKKLSTVTSAVLSNPAPAALSGLSVTNGIGSVLISWTKPTDTDYAGVLVYRSTTSGFTPGPGNLVYDEAQTSYLVETGLNAGTTYYYKFAAYDAFEKVGLNYTVEQAGTPLSNAGIPSGATNPGSGTEGDLFFNTTDGKLYRYHSGAWTAAVPTVDLVGTITTDQLGIGVVTNPKIAVDAVQAVNVQASAITNPKIAVDAIAPVNIQAAAITNVKIATDAIAPINIQANAITEVKVATNAISTNKIATSAVTTDKILDGNVTLPKLATGVLEAFSASVLGGSENLLSNSNFSMLDQTGASQALCWRLYNPSSAANVTGYSNGSWFGPTLTSGSWPATIGIRTAASIDSPYGGVGKIGTTNGVSFLTKQPIQNGETYFLTFWAVPSTGTATLGFVPYLELESGGTPYSEVTMTQVSVSAATTTGPWPALARKYTFKIDVTGLISGLKIDGLRIEILGTLSSYSWVVFGEMKLEQGVAASSWTPRVEELLPGSIQTRHLYAESVTTAALAAGSVVANKIAANTITAAQIAADTITANEIATATITANEIASNTITAAQIAANTITSNEIAANAITANEIQAGAITASKLTLTDLTNYVANGSFIGGSAASWTQTSGAGFSVVSSGGPSSPPTQHYGKIDPVVTNELVQNDLVFDLNATQPLMLKVRAAIGSGTHTSGSVNVFINFQKSNGGADAWVQSITGLTTSWQEFSFTITPPADVISGYFAFQSLGALFGDTADVYFTKVELRKQNAAELVVDGGITTSKIAANAITATKIAANTITASQIAAETITANELATNSITTVKIAANAITAAKIAADTITANEIAAGAITANELAVNSVTAGKIAADAVTANEIAANSITTVKIAANAITAAKIAADTITANEIAAGAITTNELAANAVTAAKIAANTITANEIAANTITASQIAANTISTGQLAANSITSNELAANSVIAGKINASAVSTNELAANAVTAAKIAANTITAAQIAAGTITATEIAANTITASKIAAGTITASEIAASTITTDKIVVGAATVAASSSSGGQSYGPTSGITELDTGWVTMYSFTSTGAPLTIGGSFNLAFSTSAPANIQYYIWELHIEVAGVTWTTGSGGGIAPAMSVGSGSDYIMQIQCPVALRSPTPASGANPVRYKVKMQARYPWGGGTNPVTMTNAFLGVTWACWAQENKV